VIKSAVVFFLLSTTAWAGMFSEPLSPRIANYTMDVQLDVNSHSITGVEQLVWKNTSTVPVVELQFHLYLNAFKSKNTTFFKNARSRTSASFSDSEKTGWIEISRMETGDGTDVTDRIEFIRPDDENEQDSTVIRVPLDKAVEPGGEIVLNIEFLSQLPRVVSRTGYFLDFYFAGQWFPKIGVFEESAGAYGWNCHQFHHNSEFYADFGVYDVRITLPENYVIGATGQQIEEVQNEDGTKTVRYYCEDVHDFAWTADPDFTVVEDSWEHVSIRYLVQPGRLGSAQRIIEAAKHAFDFFADWFGPYPYPVLTIVDPAFGALQSGGMEYPTLITAGASWLIPDAVLMSEAVVIHELGHNYWYGMVATNEFEEAWLDEGLTAWSEIKVMQQYYYPGSMLNLAEIKINQEDIEWSRYSADPEKAIVGQPAWEYRSGGYGAFSYSKPALMMMSLEGVVGEAAIKCFISDWFWQGKFRHPDSEEFALLLNHHFDGRFDAFFQDFLYTTKFLDYGVAGIQNQDTVAVHIRNYGSLVLPVEIQVQFAGGESQLFHWSGAGGDTLLMFDDSLHITEAVVDPGRKLWLDVNFHNNSRSEQAAGTAVFKYAGRWLFWLQNLLLALVG
jgi:hypothetical protein